MPAPLSLDLRRRIVRAYLDGEASQQEVARRFDVNEATVMRLVARHRATGSVEPTPQQHGPPARIQPEDAERLEHWLEENPSLTQAELARRFSETTGTPVSQQTVSRGLRRHAITRKKSR